MNESQNIETFKNNYQLIVGINKELQRSISEGITIEDALPTLNENNVPEINKEIHDLIAAAINTEHLKFGSKAYFNYFKVWFLNIIDQYMFIELEQKGILLNFGKIGRWPYSMKGAYFNSLVKMALKKFFSHETLTGEDPSLELIARLNLKYTIMPPSIIIPFIRQSFKNINRLSIEQLSTMMKIVTLNDPNYESNITTIVIGLRIDNVEHFIDKMKLNDPKKLRDIDLVISSMKEYDDMKSKNDEFISFADVKKNKNQIKKKNQINKNEDQNKVNTSRNKSNIIYYANVMISEPSSADNDRFLLDSGASISIVNSKKHLQDIVDTNDFINVVGRHKPIKVTKKGTLIMYGMKLDALYVPTSRYNIISTIELNKRNLRVTFTPDRCYVNNKTNKLIMVGKRNADFYFVEAGKIKNTINMMDIDDMDVDDMEFSDDLVLDVHRTLGHMGPTNIKRIFNDHSINVSAERISQIIKSCIDCQESTLLVKKPKRLHQQDIKPGQRINIDLMGPIEDHYLMVAVDAASLYVKTRWIRSRSEVSEMAIQIMKEYQAILSLTQRRIVTIRSDNEFKTRIMKEFVADNGISLEWTAGYNSASNGLAELFNRGIQNGVRRLLHAANVPTMYWIYAAEHYVFIHNNFKINAISSKSPYDTLFQSNRYLNSKGLGIFGSKMVAFRNDNRMKKDYPNYPMVGVFMGYQKTKKVAMFLDSSSMKVFEVNKFKFVEGIFPFQNLEFKKVHDSRIFGYLQSIIRDDLFGSVIREHPEATTEGQYGNKNVNTRTAEIIKPKNPVGRPKTKKKKNDDDDDFETDKNKNAQKIATRIIKPITRSQRKGVRVNKPLVEAIKSMVNNDEHENKESNSKDLIKTTEEKSQDIIMEDVSDDEFIVEIPEEDDQNSTGKVDDQQKQLEYHEASDTELSQEPPTNQMVRVYDDINRKAVQLYKEQILKENQDIDENDIENVNKKRCIESVNIAEILEEDNDKQIPVSPEKAYKNDKWKKAMLKELKGFEKHEVFDKHPIKQIDKNKSNFIDAKWVFTIKNPGTEDEIYKARLVGRGFKAKYQLADIYGNVPSLDAIRLFISLVATFKYEMRQCDVSTAFLHSSLPYDVYLKLPFTGDRNSNRMVKLNKSIYGLIESSNLFYLFMTEKLEKLGFVNTETDPGLFKHKKKDMILVLYVDDFMLAGRNNNDIQMVIDELSKEIELKDMGQPKRFLSYTINRKKEDLITLDIEEFLTKIENKHKIKLPEKFLKTPLDKGFNAEDESSELLSDDGIKEYGKIVGILNYIALVFRIDIGYCVNLLSRYNNYPRQNHLTGAKRVLQYVIQTKDKKLVYSGDTDFRVPLKNFSEVTTKKQIIEINYPPIDELHVRSLVDASFANETAKKSQHGFITFMNNNIISWSSKKQSLVATSTAAAEYIGYSASADSISGLRIILEELKYPVTNYGTLCGDNRPALELSSHKAHYQTTKHIEVRYHNVRQLVRRKKLKLCYVNTKDNLADCLTKILDAHTCNRMNELIFD
jgi:hypothetical protein